MTTATKTLLTWTEFEQLPDDGKHLEVLEGEHSRIARRFERSLAAFVEARGMGQVFPETGYKLSEDPASWVQPDVSFPGAERVRATPDAGYLEGGPDLAVEVVSPSESARDLDSKVEALLAAGSRAVLVVYPNTRRVRAFRNDGSGTRFSDTVSFPDLFPGWEMAVAKLFED